METIRLPNALADRDVMLGIVRAMREGKLFFYPTDTIYGLGCDATNPSAVRRIRAIKASRQPFSVIAPSREWIAENTVVSHPEYLERLPGPYTLIFRLKGSPVCSQVSTRTLGVRIPDHPFTSIVQEAGVPFVTTSANVSGKPPLQGVDGITGPMKEGIDIAIDGGVIRNSPSVVVDLTGPEPRTLR